MSLRSRIKRLEQLYKQSPPVGSRVTAWLVQNRPEAAKRCEELLRHYGGDNERAVRDMTDDELWAIVDAFQAVTGQLSAVECFRTCTE